MKKVIPAGVFKAECLKIMDDVQKRKHSFIITKRNKPIVKIVPLEDEQQRPIFGMMKDTAKIKDDLIEPIGEEWDASL